MSKRDDSQRVSVVLNTQLHPHNTEITPQHCDSRRLQSMQLLNRVQVNGSRKASTPLLCPHRGHTNAAFGLLIPMRFISMWQGIVWKAETCRITGIQPNHNSTVFTFCLLFPFVAFSCLLFIYAKGDTLANTRFPWRTSLSLWIISFCLFFHLWNICVPVTLETENEGMHDVAQFLSPSYSTVSIPRPQTAQRWVLFHRFTHTFPRQSSRYSKQRRKSTQSNSGSKHTIEFDLHRIQLRWQLYLSEIGSISGEQLF